MTVRQTVLFPIRRASTGPLARLFARWLRNHRTRADLARLAPPLLQDIGIDAKTARREAARPFWRG
ncbi:hypothetical protein DSD19_04230 [Rhodovulum sp. BSW8]|uniref:Uncharacterized protein YjiS (DUF1127 family) n=1 Tax=Rhodovulum visakhapatnamense TaxID=364297 RepID=A0A4R8FDA5_9RHOB|nr:MULTISPECIES: DUF1127 domain-containing protein [Rhodovulum]RBO54590.1 hypothetical protein DSD19_04230 [Rhodovulum sp. BSW8]TDX23794.1 uncharacterized protein YjiS (DUF1127 family) [Rhodovulum visakhapatnamense]